MEKKKLNQHTLNNQIAAFIKAKDSNGELYSDADLEYINQYTGSGGKGSKGATDVGLLYEFYTPDFVCDIMYKLTLKHGYKKGRILEPCAGTGRILKPFPDYSQFTCFETNEVSARICELLYKGCTVYSDYFETAYLNYPRLTSVVKKTWLEPFDLVITNPPYGKRDGFYKEWFKGYSRTEFFFFDKGMDCLKKGGLMVLISASNFFTNGDTYNKFKEKFFKKAEIVDAYRMPSFFDKTKVPTDILVFRKK